MPKVEIKHPDQVASVGSLSAGVEIDGWLFISGQAPLDLQTGAVAHGSIEEETRLALNHIGKVLQSAGYSFADVVKCTCHLGDIQDFGRFDRVYSEFFPGSVRRAPPFNRGWETESKLKSTPSHGRRGDPVD